MKSLKSMTEYALIGKKLGHSFSAVFFNEKFRREGISSHYSLVELSDFNQLLPYLHSHPDIVGLNVTIPYKEDACRACGHLTDVAKSIGAVNTIKVIRGDSPDMISLIGTNTDAPGFAKSIAPHIGNRRKALVLGTGGASKAVVYALRKMSIDVTLISRTSRSHEGDILTYDDLTENIIVEHLIIVNTTPLGMSPNIATAPPIPYQYITDRHLCFDAVYNPEETLFLRLSKEQGAETMNGLEMLHNQALLAWDFWQSESD